MRAWPGLMIAMMIAGGAPVAQAKSGKPAAIPIAAEGPIAPVTTRHAITTAKGRIDYRATWFETVLKDGAGVPQATISATSYVSERAASAARRPVVVLFNGGPGASSSPLHFSAFGPRRLGEKGAAGERALVDNDATLLDAADLLFIDPVGTGFSRPLREGGGKPYWSVQGDADAALALVRDWLTANGRSASPLFIAGESYGGYRLGVMAKSLSDLNVAGLILISPALDFGRAEDQEAIDRLPTLAVAAWHHRKPPGDRRDVAQVWEDARGFAQSDYAVALQQGRLIDPAARRLVAARLAELTGMPREMIEAANLRIDSQTFLETLVPGHVVGRLDVRVAAPRPPVSLNPDRPAAANDPSLGLGRSNVIVSKPIGDYLRGALKVPTTRDYYSLTLDVNFSWDWSRPTPLPGASWSVTGNIAKLMQARPDTRLLLLGGYYDLATPVLSARYALAHSEVPLERVSMVALPAGHSPFEGAANLARVSQVVHAFLKAERTE